MDKLEMLMNRVFSPDGKINICDKNIYSELIACASDMFPGINFGDIETGTVNPTYLLALREALDL